RILLDSGAGHPGGGATARLPLGRGSERTRTQGRNFRHYPYRPVFRLPSGGRGRMVSRPARGLTDASNGREIGTAKARKSLRAGWRFASYLVSVSRPQACCERETETR